MSDHALKQSINWISQGEGPGMLFIHGAGGNSAVWWQQMEHFCETHKAVAYDLAGFGASPAPTPDQLPDRLAGDAVAVLDAAEVDRATVVCQSLGGWSGLRLALEHPDRVERLILSCTMAGIAHPPAMQSFMESRAKMDERGPASLGLTSEFEASHPAKASVYRQIGGSNAPLDEALGMILFSPQVLVPVDALQAISCPVHTISGEVDPIWPSAALKGLVDYFPTASLTTIDGTGHSPYFEKPGAFNAAIDALMVE